MVINACVINIKYIFNKNPKTDDNYAGFVCKDVGIAAA
jgi:hypothetical protein